MKLHSNSLLIYFVTFCTSLHKNPDFYDSRILNFSHSYTRKGVEWKLRTSKLIQYIKNDHLCLYNEMMFIPLNVALRAFAE